MDRELARTRSCRTRLSARDPMSRAFVKTPSHIVAEVPALTSLD